MKYFTLHKVNTLFISTNRETCVFTAASAVLYFCFAFNMHIPNHIIQWHSLPATMLRHDVFR